MALLSRVQRELPAAVPCTLGTRDPCRPTRSRTGCSCCAERPRHPASRTAGDSRFRDANELVVKALIVGSAPAQDSHARLRMLAADADVVIAADGGGALCLAAGIVPATVVGDFDSLPPHESTRLWDAGVPFVTAPADKDVTDLDLALAEARARGADRVCATRVLGGRLDHTLASLGSLVASADLQPIIVEPGLTVWVLAPGARQRLAISGTGATVSLLTVGEHATVSCTGFRYSLDDCVLAGLSSRGISNIIETAPATVSVSSGHLIVIATSLDGHPIAHECPDSRIRGL